jgi:phosphoribosylaminoimidazole-succinocarboxamide synthase
LERDCLDARPDEYRLWLKTDYQPGKVQESYDKQLLRDWLIKTGFKDSVDRLEKQGKKPDSYSYLSHPAWLRYAAARKGLGRDQTG